MITVIHQPHFLPWLGYYNKLANCQLFIIQDNVQYRKTYFQNRTLIRDKDNRLRWLTIPVRHNIDMQISDICIIHENWKRKIISTIFHSYHKSLFFDIYFHEIESIILRSSGSLMQINCELLLYTLKVLGISITIKYASTFERQHSSTEDILYICRETGTTDLIFGEGGGLKYHGINIYKSYGIKILEQKFKNKMQLFSENYFVDSYNLSIIDYLFNLELSVVKDLIFNTWKV